jgi:hypothetical protein
MLHTRFSYISAGMRSFLSMRGDEKGGGAGYGGVKGKRSTGRCWSHPRAGACGDHSGDLGIDRLWTIRLRLSSPGMIQPSANGGITPRVQLEDPRRGLRLRAGPPSLRPDDLPPG